MDAIKESTHELADLRLISTKIEQKMRLEGFDCIRLILATNLSLREWIRSKCHIFQLPCIPQLKVYGSIGEGLFYPINCSCERDIDIVYICDELVAVENASYNIQYSNTTMECLIENDPSSPGYCYLRVIHNGSVSCSQNAFTLYISSSLLRTFILMNMISSNAQGDILCNVPEFWGIVNAGQLGQQGPASNVHITPSLSKLNISKCDMVVLIPCRNWPSAAYEWISRERRYGWPTEKQIREIVDQGIYFAPVGCKKHPLEGFQWRYSFNEAEKRLVQSFNPTQAKCYVLLKRIICENVTVLIKEDFISSYHLKTLMFWTIEETDSIVWIPANLVQCVFLILNRLLQCAERVYCPSYFLRDENLFISKVTLENKGQLIAILSCIIAEGWPVLARLSNFAIDSDFLDSLFRDYGNNTPNTFQLLSSITTLPGIFGTIIQRDFYHFLAESDMQEIDNANGIHSKFGQIINDLILEASGCDDALRKEILQNLLANVCSSYGTHLLSLSRLQSKETMTGNIDDNGETYITMSCWRNQVECLAKHANYAYMRGNFQSTISTTFNVLRRYFSRHVNTLSTFVRSDVQTFNIRFKGNNDLLHSSADAFVEQGGIDAVKALVMGMVSGTEVIFQRNEIHAVPENVKVEMFLIGTKIYPTDPIFMFKPCIVLDPYFYVTYLAFLALCDMRLREESDKVLQTMENICSETPNSHLPASLNLLGDCYLKLGRVDKAIEKFALSMKRNNRKNAAPWHVARLVWGKLLCK